MDRDDAIRKVRALLALGSSDNEHESAAAIGRAQAIMEQHAIEEASLAVDQDDPEEEEIRAWEEPIAKAGAHWRGILARVLAQANGCDVYRSEREYRIYGRASQVGAVRYLFGYCAGEVDKLAAQRAGNGRTWINNYRLGCVDAIKVAIKAERDALREKLRSEAEGSALVVLNKALAKIEADRGAVELYGRKVLHLRSASSSGSRADHGARNAGRNDGRGIYPGGNGGRALGAGRARING